MTCTRLGDVYWVVVVPALHCASSATVAPCLLRGNVFRGYREASGLRRLASTWLCETGDRLPARDQSLVRLRCLLELRGLFRKIK